MSYARQQEFEDGCALMACSVCGVQYLFPTEIKRYSDGLFRCERTCAEQPIQDRDRIIAASRKRREVPPPPFGLTTNYQQQLHTVVAGTVGLWQLQGSLVDTSGNGLHLTMERGTEAYTDLGSSGMQGFDFDGTRNLLAPLSSLLQLTGELTIEFLIVPENNTIIQTFVQCETLPAVSTALYAYYFAAGAVQVSFADQFIATLTPMGPPPVSLGTVGEVSHYAIRRRQSGAAGHFKVEAFRNGQQHPVSFNSLTNVSDGTELMRVGGFQQQANLRGVMASLRIVNVSRTNAEIYSDYKRVWMP